MQALKRDSGSWLILHIFDDSNIEENSIYKEKYTMKKILELCSTMDFAHILPNLLAQQREAEKEGPSCIFHPRRASDPERWDGQTTTRHYSTITFSFVCSGAMNIEQNYCLNVMIITGEVSDFLDLKNLKWWDFKTLKNRYPGVVCVCDVGSLLIGAVMVLVLNQLLDGCLWYM